MNKIKLLLSIISLLSSMGSNYCSADHVSDEIYTYFYESNKNKPKAELLQYSEPISDSYNNDNLLIIEKEIKIKDSLDRDVSLIISSDLLKNKIAYTKFDLINLNIDSSLRWDGEISLSKIKEIKRLFSLSKNNDSFKIYGNSIEFERIGDKEFKITIPKTSIIKNIEFFDKNDCVVDIDPIEESKDIFNNVIAFFNYDNIDDLKLMVESKEPDNKSIKNINISIDVKPNCTVDKHNEPLFEYFNLLYWNKQQGNNIIALSPIQTNVKIIRDEKFIKLQNDKKDTVLARFGIFRTPFSNELLILGVEGYINNSSLYMDTIIKIQENTKNKFVNVKAQGSIPNPPRIVLSIKE